jgi:epoxyqueuosine reductase
MPLKTKPGVICMDKKNIIKNLESVGFRAAFMPFAAIIKIPKLYEAYINAIGHTQSKTDKQSPLPQPPSLSFEVRSFLVVAFSDSAAELCLKYKGKRISIPIPPEFINESTRQQLQDTLKDALAKHQYIKTREIPLKLLAVSSGLGRYGHNTLCYVDGFGSYCSLESYYTDIPCEDKDWNLAVLDNCETCARCAKNCATGALGGPFIMDGDRCLYAQNMSSQSMPDWLSPEIHHTLIGCLRCQEACPINQSSPAPAMESLKLSELETEALLSLSPDVLAPRLLKKFKDYGMTQKIISVAGRNAKLFIEAKKRKGEL